MGHAALVTEIVDLQPFRNLFWRPRGAAHWLRWYVCSIEGGGKKAHLGFAMTRAPCLTVGFTGSIEWTPAMTCHLPAHCRQRNLSCNPLRISRIVETLRFFVRCLPLASVRVRGERRRAEEILPRLRQQDPNGTMPRLSAGSPNVENDSPRLPAPVHISKSCSVELACSVSVCAISCTFRNRSHIRWCCTDPQSRPTLRQVHPPSNGHRFAERQSKARGTKRLIYRLCFTVAFFFCQFPPKNRMSSPKTI